MGAGHLSLFLAHAEHKARLGEGVAGQRRARHLKAQARTPRHGLKWAGDGPTLKERGVTTGAPPCAPAVISSAQRQCLGLFFSFPAAPAHPSSRKRRRKKGHAQSKPPVRSHLEHSQGLAVSCSVVAHAPLHALDLSGADGRSAKETQSGTWKVNKIESAAAWATNDGRAAAAWEAVVGRADTVSKLWAYTSRPAVATSSTCNQSTHMTNQEHKRTRRERLRCCQPWCRRKDRWGLVGALLHPVTHPSPPRI